MHNSANVSTSNYTVLHICTYTHGSEILIQLSDGLAYIVLQ